MVTRALAVTTALAASACLPKVYHCASNSDCGASGVCQSTGFCSFTDPACTSGLRYGDLSGAYTGQCVGTESGIDARVDSLAGSDAPGDAPPAPFCDPSGEPTLIGCWEFEGNVNDASGHNNNGTATAVTYAAGKVGQGAVLTDNTSHIAVTDSVSLTPTHITIEGWIHPTSLPASGRMGILDGDGKYGFFIYPGQLECFVNVTVTATITFSAATWTHVACTYDGTTGIIYINGAQAATAGGGVALGAGSTNGIALGGNSPSADTLVGMIDQYRMYSEPRSAAQICRDAGLTTCP